MANKSQRDRKRGRPRLSPAQMVRPTSPGKGETQGPRSGGADLREEYHYVGRDLKQIAIIAAVMLAVMIVLALIAV